MIGVSQIASRQLLQATRFGFAGLPFGKKRIPTKNDLPKYDVVVVGGDLGGVFATHLDAVMHDHVKTIVSYESSSVPLEVNRMLYEQGDLQKTKMVMMTKSTIAKNVAHTEGTGVEKIEADKNQIILKNGRTIGYEFLVVNSSQVNTHRNINGFEQAWADVLHPFYTNNEHASWRSITNKAYRHIYNFNGGNSIFYIPPEPYFNPITSFNFLVAKATWDMQVHGGKLSWDTSNMTIINANPSFSKHFDKLDGFLKQQLEAKNIHYEQGLKLVEVKKDQQHAVFQTASGELVTRPYSSLYSLMPTAASPLIASSGLGDSEGFLDVCPKSLTHRKYSNIYGFGDSINTPTTRTFYGSLAQLAVVRHNVERRLKGLEADAAYDGFAEAPLYLTPSNMCWVSHLYNGVEVSFDTSSFSTGLRSTIHGMFGKKQAQNIMAFKNWGPPYYKTKKTFGATPTKSATTA